MFVKSIEILSIIIFSPTILLGNIFPDGKTKTNAVMMKIDNPVIGKIYWMYEKTSPWALAKETCEKSGHELVQMPTKNEQKWIDTNLADYRTYWVGATNVGNDAYWKVPNGMILVNRKRFFSFYIENAVITAHQTHLHWEFKTALNFIICQQEYSRKEANFEKLNGKHHFRQKINHFTGGTFQCISKCMMTAECKAFHLDILKGYCHLYRSFMVAKPQEDGIDCNSSSANCFARL